jgi:hypothetical protein
MKMRHILLLIIFTFGLIGIYSNQVFNRQSTLASAQLPAPSVEITNEQKNEQFVKDLSARIAGRENESAEKVFKNMQIPWLRTASAGQLLSIMNFGYSRALGVACTHCHVENDFASDEKRPKLAAREMAFMHRMINEQLLKMQNLASQPEKRSINCATCHRGVIKPGANPK